MKFLLLSLITYIDRSKTIEQRLRESYDLFRRLWREAKVTWSGKYRPSLTDAETWPRPLQKVGVQPVFTSIEDAVERSSMLVGSPQQIIDKVHRYHERFGHSVTHLSADTEGLTEKQNRASLELFASDIAGVLRRLKGR
jgi:alkanesulfonate monooxygenase SsuD/methylene tetrahydromethanopterin reductase-like flavin-dependent oxidoreductase (luciferase family)